MTNIDLNTRNRFIADIVQHIKNKIKFPQEEGKSLETFELGFNSALEELRRDLIGESQRVLSTDQEVWDRIGKGITDILSKINMNIEKIVTLIEQDLGD